MASVGQEKNGTPARGGAGGSFGDIPLKQTVREQDENGTVDSGVKARRAGTKRARGPKRKKG